MELNSLSAISPIDGRYRNQTQSLAPYFSEFGLIKYRVQVEIEYLLFLAEKKSIILQWSYLKWVAAASIILSIGIALFNTHQKANTLAISSLSNDEIALYLQEHEWVSQSETIETYNLEQISETTLDELLKEQLNTL